MSFAKNLSGGLVAVGKLESLATLCSSVAAAACLCSFAASRLEQDKTNKIKGGAKVATYAAVGCLACCLIACGLLTVYSAATNNNVAGEAGAKRLGLHVGYDY